ncbi:SirB2 family protein [Rhizobacter sp. Root404]|uniref:SirB2 family protein n=1 Tax=Rhizobacter sp. Root404 TaxID=1736528 RepID=UPI0006FCAFCE|nr:SirB2 family protein [Rhizobacter sp. Root404]KQW36554.1 invasion protein [Rhizobacter sp. Root404]
MDYSTIKLIHQSAVALSLPGFFARGTASFAGAAWLQHRMAKTLPQVVDTVLLVAAVTLAWLARLNPAEVPWLLAKLIGLVMYIALGVVALKPTYGPATRALAFAGALATAAWIVSVAITKTPRGLFPLMTG